MKRSRKISIVLLILVSLIALDHVTKWVAIRYLKDAEVAYYYLGDLFRLQYAENTGAFLSLGAGLPDGARAVVMTGLNALILGGLLCYVLLSKKIGLLSLCAFSLVAAGGIGNLIDRIFRDGRVVDFMNMGVSLGGFSLRTGIFNVADVAIMIGLFLVVANEVIFMRRDKEEKDEGLKQKNKASTKR